MASASGFAFDRAAGMSDGVFKDLLPWKIIFAYESDAEPHYGGNGSRLFFGRRIFGGRICASAKRAAKVAAWTAVSGSQKCRP